MKNKHNSMQETLATAIRKITPSEDEKKKQEKIAQEIMQKIMKISGKHEHAELVGSNARNTHLKGDHDLDIFVFYPKNTQRNEFEQEGLRIGKLVFRGKKWEKAYSEHPYIRGTYNGFDVEIVPAYNIQNASEMQSAVDRTTFHNQYLLGKLGEKQKSEVRLLKQFLKGIKVYGADLKASGVPGYVTELLILNYGSFEETLKAISNWKEREIIDLEKQTRKIEAEKKFSNPLIIIDPVDANRNVAAALSITQYARMIAAARAFLKKPSLKFFFGAKIKIMPLSGAKKLVEKEGLITIEIGYPKKELSDVLWGQIRSVTKKIVSSLEQKNFSVLRSEAWSDDEKQIIIVVDLEANKLEKIMKRTGPHVSNAEHSEAFLKAHKNALSGPRIEKGKWVVEIERKHWKATEYLKEVFKELRKTEKGGMKKALNKKAKILSDAEVISKYKKDAKFKEWFSSYLKGKEEFEEY